MFYVAASVANVTATAVWHNRFFANINLVTNKKLIWTKNAKKVEFGIPVQLLKILRFTLSCILQYCSLLVYFEKKQILTFEIDQTGLDKNAAWSHVCTLTLVVFIIKFATDRTIPLRFRSSHFQGILFSDCLRKMKLFVAIVNGFQQLIIILKYGKT